MSVRILLIASLLAGAVLGDVVSTTRPVMAGYKPLDFPIVGARVMVPESTGVRPQPGGKLVLYDLEHHTATGERVGGLLEARTIDAGDIKDLAGLVASIKRRIEKDARQNFVITVLRDTKTTFGGKPAWLLEYTLSNPISRKTEHRSMEILYFEQVGRSIRLKFGWRGGQWDLVKRDMFEPVLDSVTWVQGN